MDLHSRRPDAPVPLVHFLDPDQFALFAPRAPYTAPNSVFQLKMTLLLAAAIYQLAVNLAVLRRPTISVTSLRASGVLGVMLWVALAITACWFILFE